MIWQVLMFFRTLTLSEGSLLLTAQEIANHADSKAFRMYDDDGALYYEGFCVLPNGLSARAFAPLEDFGTPNAGATRIDYLVKGKGWVTL